MGLGQARVRLQTRTRDPCKLSGPVPWSRVTNSIRSSSSPDFAGPMKERIAIMSTQCVTRPPFKLICTGSSHQVHPPMGGSSLIRCSEYCLLCAAESAGHRHNSASPTPLCSRGTASPNGPAPSSLHFRPLWRLSKLCLPCARPVPCVLQNGY